jgi:hypothetical protein
MLVQAASGPNLQPPGEWRRRAVGGNAPTLLRVATWAIAMRDGEIENIAIAIGKSILVFPAILFIVAWPIGGGTGAARTMVCLFLLPKYPMISGLGIGSFVLILRH